jgi:hypothetical protein
MKQTEDRGKCLCRACNQTFRRLSTFDIHRVGPWTDRRCLSVAEMLARGFSQDSLGYWRQAARKVALIKAEVLSW